MPGETKIQWCWPTYDGLQYAGKTWNAMTGCVEVSLGCDRCYAKTFAERFRGVPGNYYEHGFDFQLRPQQVDKPLTWKQPSCIFVNSMSDVFFEDAPDDYILKMFEVMLAAPQHIYQILTKRVPRMARLSTTKIRDLIHEKTGSDRWPWNIWMGVTIESSAQKGRLKWLREVPSPVRFVSYEPAIGPLPIELSGVQWLIAGGESGSGARPIDPDWFRTVRDHCVASDTAFFMKQMGSQWMREHFPQDYQKDTHGGDMAYFPEDLRIREYPTTRKEEEHA